MAAKWQKMCIFTLRFLFCACGLWRPQVTPVCIYQAKTWSLLCVAADMGERMEMGPEHQGGSTIIIFKETSKKSEVNVISYEINKIKVHFKLKTDFSSNI